MRKNPSALILLLIGLTAHLHAQPAPDAGTIGIRNYDQVYRAMIAVTGVTPDQPLREFYEAARGQFSVNGRPQTLTAPMLLNLSIMAAMFCQRFIASEGMLNASARRAHERIDFMRDQTQLDAATRNHVFTRYGELFWRRTPTEAELRILSQAMDEALQGRPNATAETTNALLVACTAALSSIDFLRL